jgi:hypothetical protein
MKKYRPPTEIRPVDCFWIHKRGTATLEAQNTYHVAPAGTHQPLFRIGNNDEQNLWMTAARELCEEIYGLEDDLKRLEHGADFRNSAKVEPVLDALFGSSFSERPASEIYLLGVGCDPVTTKPEILTVIVCDWAAAQARASRRNSNSSLDLKKTWEGPIQRDTLLPSNLLKWATKPPSKMLPAGAACLLQAHRLFDQIMEMFNERGG